MCAHILCAPNASAPILCADCALILCNHILCAPNSSAPILCADCALILCAHILCAPNLSAPIFEASISCVILFWNMPSRGKQCFSIILNFLQYKYAFQIICLVPLN